MNAVLGTLPFIATLWLLTVLGAAVLEESGTKIVAALKGRSLQQSCPAQPRARNRRISQFPRRANVGWRAAA
jgi:hypothetical protein